MAGAGFSRLSPVLESGRQSVQSSRWSPNSDMLASQMYRQGASAPEPLGDDDSPGQRTRLSPRSDAIFRVRQEEWLTGRVAEHKEEWRSGCTEVLSSVTE